MDCSRDWSRYERFFRFFRSTIILTSRKTGKMLSPEKTDYIDIHTHQQKTDPDIFSVHCLLTHQIGRPHDYPGTAVSIGAHPWFIERRNYWRPSKMWLSRLPVPMLLPSVKRDSIRSRARDADTNHRFRETGHHCQQSFEAPYCPLCKGMGRTTLYPHQH